ncbi:MULTISPECIES: hydroxyphenylacetyl-CoA thioesterase PaaI [unclassified Rhizobium]|jgi:acyl-CoA thioesterase|uniref:hydroxyphenylacetyl-CoA thioesterase PaaI n=1 Tax=unclassified Rhizobium TaxID=2613769 RepID=UPI0006459B4F|nr:MULTISPECIES: hydroxyphenylacetyl-CoA thioesterase PaaI [unclassified Rhizobium]MBN8953539.1 hydroxyphenylacetyl-CoA thioesterase PaaI [Rhizobium tropici]OJY73259.1 MAG: phenylacetic acid degradation protein PaaD [Rhizobium sp. 60-20]RKD72228.1 acyl-CoA thioesterase [Rhizobium sp. WW_1]
MSISNNLSPQALAEACAKSMWDEDNASRHLGMELKAVSPGEATLSMVITEAMTNGHGTCHGGYIFTLADSAFAFACNSYNQRTVAQHCSVTFIAPVFAGDRLTATAREVSRRGRGGIYDIAITNQEGEQIAEFRGHSRTVKGMLLPE